MGYKSKKTQESVTLKPFSEVAGMGRKNGGRTKPEGKPFKWEGYLQKNHILTPIMKGKSQ